MAEALTKAGAKAGKRRTLVTGGAGFVGGNLCEQLLSEGYSVVRIDNLSTGPLHNTTYLEGNGSLGYLRHDVATHIEYPGELGEVYHFGSPASPKDFSRISIGILEAGASGARNSMVFARAKGVGFLLASSFEVYGDPLVHLQHEEDRGNVVNSVGVRGVNDEAKRYAEALTMAYRRHRGVDTRIVRIFNGYGRRMCSDDARGAPDFVTQALSGEPLTVHGEGTQTRSIQYVDNLVAGVFSLMHCSESRSVNIVNIGNPPEMSVLQLAELVIRLSGSESKIISESLPEDDPERRCPDISRAREVPRWEPQVPAAKGPKVTLGWFAERLGNRHREAPAP